MKLNEEHCRLIISGHKSEAVWAKIGHKKHRKGQTIRRECLISLWKKAGKKLSALVRLANFLSLEQRKLSMKNFIESQFGYRPLP